MLLASYRCGGEAVEQFQLRRRVSQDAAELPQVLQDVRRATSQRASELGLIDVYAAIIRTYPFKANVHVNYQESVLPMHDGLPKFRDVPKEMGGTGEMVATA
jgi:hypothetical protein